MLALPQIVSGVGRGLINHIPFLHEYLIIFIFRVIWWITSATVSNRGYLNILINRHAKTCLITTFVVVILKWKFQENTIRFVTYYCSMDHKKCGECHYMSLFFTFGCLSATLSLSQPSPEPWSLFLKLQRLFYGQVLAWNSSIVRIQ